jgi:glutamate-1-semialdehyde 2,1-aminomutase
LSYLERNLDRFVSRTKASRDLYEKAVRVIPGGISANAKFAPPYPLFMHRGSGSRITDVDGNVYVDYCMGYGPLILGHGHPDVMKAVQSLLEEHGTYFFGTPTTMELKLAEKLCDLVPCAEMVRFTNSGNEATLAAARLARAYTKREKIARFEGHYHGWNDFACISYNPPLDMVGPRDGPNSVPQSAGLAPGTAEKTVVLQFNDTETLEKQIRQHKDQLAGVIIEPVSKAFLAAEPEFMKALRELTTKYGIVLIFDEVITGMRLGLAGAQGHYGVKPDLVAMGKAISGGFTMGAFAGSKDIMKLVSPTETDERRIFHSGTFNGHPAAMVAGLKTIEILETTDALQRANGAAQAIRNGLKEIATDRHVEAQSFGVASTFHILFTKNEVKCHRDVLASDMNKLLAYDYGMWSKGIFLIPRHAGYTSAVHTKEDVEKTLQVADQVIRELK